MTTRTVGTLHEFLEGTNLDCRSIDEWLGLTEDGTDGNGDAIDPDLFDQVQELGANVELELAEAGYLVLGNGEILADIVDGYENPWQAPFDVTEPIEEIFELANMQLGKIFGW